jgi:branched-chain amino acid transport system permease protein
MLVQVVISGITSGAVYALIALGFVMIYKAAGVMNFAQGQIVTLGAYFAVTLRDQMEFSYAASFLCAIFATGLLGVVLERLFFRPLIKAHESSVIIATIATGIILENVVRLVWGSEFYPFKTPFGVTAIDVGFALVTPQELWILGITTALVLLLYAYFEWTKHGLAMRAVAINQTGSALMGINVGRVFSATWAINSALGAAAGILFAPLLAVTPVMGNAVSTSAFAAAVLGGAKSLPGAIVGGLTLGVVENLVGFYISTALKPLLSFTIIIAILMVRPAGLLGQEEIKKV